MHRRTGIAGYSGSGKSTVAQLLAGRKDIAPAIIIDADTEAKDFIAHDRMVIDQIVDVFGRSVIEKNELNFSVLGRIVFSSKERLVKYNAIVHPPFLIKLQDLLDQQGDRDIVVDAALIPLWGIDTWFDSCIWVHASYSARVLRVKSRYDNPDMVALENRLSIQEELLKEPDGKHWVRLPNEGGLEELARRVSVLH